MKKQSNADNIDNKKECKICRWKNDMDANYCEQCGYRFASIFKMTFLLKIKCKHVNQKFRYCSKCGCKLDYHYKIDKTENWKPSPYTDEKIKRIRKRWYQFWR